MVSQLVEISRDIILDTIKAEIAAALAGIRTDRADSRVSTEPPRQYFIYDGAQTYQCPAVFAVVERANFPDEATGSNFIDARVSVNIGIVAEDQDAEKLTIKVERYQAALFQILHQRQLMNAAQNVKVWTRVTDIDFSPIFARQQSQGMGQFRKEAVLKLEVQHFEDRAG